MFGRSFTALEECTLYYPEGKSEDLSSCKAVQVDMPACTALRLWGSPVIYSLFSCPNVRILEICPDGDPDAHGVTFQEAIFKPLHDFIHNCSHLQQLEIILNYSLELDSLIQFVFCGAWEQGIWRDIRSVQANVLFDELLEGSANERDHFVSQMVGHQQRYEKQWVQFTVTKRVDRVILNASM
jgi:hypothetical protein